MAQKTVNQSMKVNGITKAMLNMQTLLLRRNWMGSMGQFVMVITTTGRKSGQQYSTPIGYLRDGADIIALNMQGRSNWYKNALAHPEVKLNIQGKEIDARAEPITDPAEIQRVFDRYRQEQTHTFPRMFGAPAEAPASVLAQARDARKYIRFILH